MPEQALHRAPHEEEQNTVARPPRTPQKPWEEIIWGFLEFIDGTRSLATADGQVRAFIFLEQLLQTECPTLQKHGRMVIKIERL